MYNNATISEYIDNLTFKKRLGRGYNPDEVYEAICNLTSMYNDVLSDAYQEIAQLKEELAKRETETPRAPGVPPAIPVFQPVAPPPDPGPPPPIEVPVTAIGEPKDLRRMKRKKLLEVLLDSSEENQQLRGTIDDIQLQNRQLRASLEDKQLKINRAGTLAEASVLLNGVVESTQAAAQQYLDNLEDLYHREQVVCQQKEEEAQRQVQDMLTKATLQCEQMVNDAAETCAEMEKQSQTICNAMRQQARLEADRYWADVTNRLETFYDSHKGLREMLATLGDLPTGGRYG